MFVVYVTFDIEPDHADQFRRAVLVNARSSLNDEENCLRFDVARDEGTGRFVLWEVYTDRQAHEAHRQTQHFKAFDSIVAPWIMAKSVETFTLISDPAV